MEINKIYDVLKSKYDVIDHDEFIVIMDGLRNYINYFVEFSFDDENIWAKMKFPEVPEHPEFQKLLIIIYIPGEQFSKYNIETNKHISLNFKTGYSDKLIKNNVNLRTPIQLLKGNKDPGINLETQSLLPLLAAELFDLKNQIEIKDNEIIQLKERNDQLEQLTLFPDFAKEPSALITKKFFKASLDIAYFNHIEMTYPERLNNELIPGTTVKDILDENRTWLNSLNLKDMENYIKLFAFINLVKDKGKRYMLDFTDLGNGRYMIKVVTDNNFYKHFLRKKPLRKNYEGYDPRDKKKLLTWLYENRTRRRTILEGNGGLYLSDVSLYEIIFDDNQDDLKTMGLIVNTSFIPEDMKDFFKIPTKIFDDIDDQLEIIKQDAEYKKINKLDYISNYEIFILRFYILLLNLVHPNALTESENGFKCITQRLNMDEFYIRMGNPKTVIKHNLIKRGKKRQTSDKQTNTEIKFLNYILNDYVFRIAKNLKWITSTPEISGKNVIFRFNPYQFIPGTVKEDEKE